MNQTQYQPSPRPMALMLVEGFPPAFGRGGPPVSAANLVATTRDMIDWRVISRNDDAGDPRPLAQEGVWLGQDPCILRTNSYRRMHQAARFAVQRWPIRAVLANSLFAPSTRAAGLVCLNDPNIRFVVLPRGELDPGALKLKPVRKAAFIRTLKAFGVESRILLGTTSDIEVKNMRNIFPRATFLSIPDLPIDPTKVPCAIEPQQGPTRLIFNSRVSEKKGLDNAIQALLRHKHPIHLDIFGGDNSAYANRCRSLTALAPKHVFISWKGLVPPAELHARLKDYDGMILPTLGENFGHSIAESLAAGTPVFLTDTTPWTRAIGAGAGFVLESHLPDAVSKALARFEAMTFAERAAMRQAARAAALEAHGNSALVAEVRGSLSRLVESSATAKTAWPAQASQRSIS